MLSHEVKGCLEVGKYYDSDEASRNVDMGQENCGQGLNFYAKPHTTSPSLRARTTARALLQIGSSTWRSLRGNLISII